MIRNHLLLPALICTMFLLLLAACDAKKEPLVGVRLPIVAVEENMLPDQELAKHKITLPKPVANDSWPQQGCDATHMSRNLSLGTNLQRAWDVTIGQGRTSCGRILATPIVIANQIVTLDTGGFLSAYNIKNGEMLWGVSVFPENKDYDTTWGGGVASDQAGVLYVSTAMCEALAINSQNGAILWRSPLSSPCRNAPTVHNGRLYIINVNNQVEVLDCKSGKVLWRHTGSAICTNILGTGTPAAYRNFVVVPYSSGEVFALRADTGTIIWSEIAAGQSFVDSCGRLSHIRAQPVLDNNQLFIVSHNERLTCIDTRRGKQLWHRDTGGIRTVAVVDKYLFQVNSKNKIICIDKKDGRIYWIKPLPQLDTQASEIGDGSNTASSDGSNNGGSNNSANSILWSDPVVAGDLIYLAGLNGELIAIDPANGEVKHRYAIGSPVFVAPIIAQQMLFVLTDDATLVAFKPAS